MAITSPIFNWSIRTNIRILVLYRHSNTKGDKA